MINSLIRLLRGPAAWASLALAPLASAQTLDQLIPHNVKLECVDYLGTRAVKMTEDGVVTNGEAYAIVKDAALHDGAVELELAGRPAPGAESGARGFIGVPRPSVSTRTRLAG